MEVTRKHSKKRDAILQCICSTKTHPSAEWVYQQLKPQIPDLSLGTVYRNIAMFKADGTIQSIGTVQGLERYDGNIDPHVHFVCTDCGTVTDLHGLQIPDELNTAAARESGAEVDYCHLTFHGRCRTCV